MEMAAEARDSASHAYDVPPMSYEADQFDRGIEHMADATLTWIGEHMEAATLAPTPPDDLGQQTVYSTPLGKRIAATAAPTPPDALCDLTCGHKGEHWLADTEPHQPRGNPWYSSLAPTPPDALPTDEAVLDWLYERGDDQRMADAYQLVAAALAYPKEADRE
jgi:hypothetical protein